MTPEQFCYWLQGFAELSGDNPPTPEQWKSIREHVATVFRKVTPPVLLPPAPERSAQDIFDKYIKNKPADAWPPRQYESPYTLNGPTPTSIC